MKTVQRVQEIWSRHEIERSFVFLCLVFLMFLPLFIAAFSVVTCWERADLLALVGDVYCIFVTSHVVSWVRCGT